ncbi:hypothetical protein D0N36_17820 [Hymenobacter lapidiphilus]|uniref:carboxypeptidase-like regulatory domain-containing protein n=1 Tax=Hymenobacter sp. CCM 8763 TaxID=2303334 RepID=UPI000E34E6D0|nr:carboxypeptidase-like regulatory domain-containing protein [Hymenobacter sp. CCM 8763]RFP63726.1 hypothetical protein D0N36_17820 [Hymenobacter sp. CCM 8763]
MDSSTPTTPEITPENEDFSPDITPDEEELSSGNGRLALIAGGIVAAVLVGYLLLPTAITNPGGTPELPTPTMMLGEASITGTRTPDETAPADAATAATPVETAKPAPAAARTAATARNTAAAPAAAPEADGPDEVALAPVVPATPVAVAEPAELAPTTLKLNGRVLDENGQPLAGATILLKGSKAATSTDANGNYALEVPAGTDNTLLYGYAATKTSCFARATPKPRTLRSYHGKAPSAAVGKEAENTKKPAREQAPDVSLGIRGFLRLGKSGEGRRPLAATRTCRPQRGNTGSWLRIGCRHRCNRLALFVRAASLMLPP